MKNTTFKEETQQNKKETKFYYICQFGSGCFVLLFFFGKIPPMEGVSFLKTLARVANSERLLAFEHQGIPAVRKSG